MIDKFLYKFFSGLDKLCEANSVSWEWVKGHSTNEFNNLADELATKAIK